MSSSTQRLPDNLRGALWLSLAMVVLTVEAMLLRLADGSVPLSSYMLLRSGAQFALGVCLLTALGEAVGDGTADAEGAVVDLSASRHALELAGPRTRDVLAAACALDLHPRAFPVGHATQTLLARAPLLLELADDAPTWRLLVRPSFVAYVVDWLTDAMAGA